MDRVRVLLMLSVQKHDLALLEKTEGPPKRRCAARQKNNNNFASIHLTSASPRA